MATRNARPRSPWPGSSPTRSKPEITLVDRSGHGDGQVTRLLAPHHPLGQGRPRQHRQQGAARAALLQRYPLRPTARRAFEAALVKGMGNYLCLDRLTEEEPLPAARRTTARLSACSTMGDFDEWDGDLDLLPTSLLPTDLRGRVAADSDQCAWSKCPYFGDCYVRKMRERSRMRSGDRRQPHAAAARRRDGRACCCPSATSIVIDEAHHLEEEATRAFTITVTPGRVQSLLAQHRLRETRRSQTQQEATGANVRCWDAARTGVARPDAKGTAAPAPSRWRRGCAWPRRLTTWRPVWCAMLPGSRTTATPSFTRSWPNARAASPPISAPSLGCRTRGHGLLRRPRRRCREC